MGRFLSCRIFTNVEHEKYIRQGVAQKLHGQVEVGVCSKKMAKNYVHVLNDLYPCLNGKMEIFGRIAQKTIGQIPSTNSVYANFA